MCGAAGLCLRREDVGEQSMWRKIIDDKFGGLSGKDMALKTLLSITANLLIAIGVALFVRSQLGSDPISVWLDGLDRTLHCGLGNASMINSSITLTVSIIFAFKFINVGTIVSTVGFSLLLGWVDPIIGLIIGGNDTLLVKGIMIAVGMVVMCMGCGLSVALRFGFSSTDSIIFRILDFHPTWQYRYMKITVDGCFIVAGFLLGGIVGVGTVIGFLFTGPMVSFFVPIWDKLVLRPLHLDHPFNQMMSGKKKKEVEKKTQEAEIVAFEEVLEETRQTEQADR